MRHALISGVTGQDGSYLADLLIEKGYQVFGLIRRSSSDTSLDRIKHLLDNKNFHIIYGDLGDSASLHNAVRISQPDEVYNLAAQSHVRVSFDMPEYTADITGSGVMRLLEAVREIKPTARFYQASSSEMFGEVAEVPQKETTPFHPRSPYGVAKVYAYWACVNYREAYGMFICNGILFNHESERRNQEFVTRKITKAVAKIKNGKQKELLLGNLEARRDWGYAPNYVYAMWLMLQQNNPGDYVIATGETHSIKEFVKKAFDHVGLNWQDYVKHDVALERPSEVNLLIGDMSKAKKILGWEPKVKFDELVKIMVDHDLKEESNI